eukprot:11942722-Heterocapsa_arctica.AAC.1
MISDNGNVSGQVAMVMWKCMRASYNDQSTVAQTESAYATPASPPRAPSALLRDLNCDCDACESSADLRYLALWRLRVASAAARFDFSSGAIPAMFVSSS